jgi:hypothetical protein
VEQVGRGRVGQGQVDIYFARVVAETSFIETLISGCAIANGHRKQKLDLYDQSRFVIAEPKPVGTRLSEVEIYDQFQIIMVIRNYEERLSI